MPSLTYAARGQTVVQDVHGNAQAGASVLVKAPDGSTATLYTDHTKGTRAPNPTVADGYGQLAFFSDQLGVYTLLVTTPAGTFSRDVEVIVDPADDAFASDVAAETARAEAAEGTLAGSIATETTNRAAADAAHAAASPAHPAAKVSVAGGAGVTSTNVQAAIAEITGFITSQEAGDSAAIAAEVAARISGDNAEATTRAAADATLLPKSFFTANTIAYGDTGGALASLAVPPSTFLLRGPTGGVTAASFATAAGYLSAYIGGGGGGSPATIDSLATWGADATNYDAATDSLLDTTGNGHNARFGSTVGADGNDPLLLNFDSVVGRYIYLPGTSGNYLSMADSVGTSVIGDTTIAIDFAMFNWAPGTQMTLASKFTSAANQRTWRVDLSSFGFPQLVVSHDGTAISGDVNGSTVSCAGSLPSRFTADTMGELIIKRRASDGLTQFFTAPAMDGAQTQLGLDGSSPIGTLYDSSAGITISGSSSGSSLPAAMKFYRFRQWSDLTQTNLVVDIDTRDPSLSSPFASFFEASADAGAVTINRSSAGRKTTVVSRTGLLFGVDDYLAVADPVDGSLDFAHADSFTLVDVFRFQGNPAADQVLMAKKADLATAPGPAMWIDSSGRLNGTVADGTVQTPALTSAALTFGQLYVVALVRDGTAHTLSLIINGVASGTVADNTTGSLANSEELRVSRLSGAGTSYADVYGVAWRAFPLALTPAQMVTLQGELVLDTSTAFVPVSGAYAIEAATVYSSGIVGESQPRATTHADGSKWISDGSYAAVRAEFMSRHIGGTPEQGAERVFYGPGAGQGAVLYKNTAVGYAAMKTGGNFCRASTAMGSHAGEFSNVPELTVYGANAAAKAVNCFFLHCLGAHAGETVVDGTSSTHVGDEAGSNMTTSTHNVVVGFYNMTTYGENMNGNLGNSPDKPQRVTSMGDYAGFCGDHGLGDPDITDATIYGYNARTNKNFTLTLGAYARTKGAGSVAIGTDHTGTGASTSVQDEFMVGTGLHSYNFPGTAMKLGILSAKGSFIAASAATVAAEVMVGTNGQVLTADSAQTAGVKWATPLGSGMTPTAVKTANYAAAANELVPVDTTSNSVTVTLPTAPASGTWNLVKHVIQGGTNTVSLVTGGSDVFNKAGGGTTLTIPMLNQAAWVQYRSGIWYVMADDLSLASLDARYLPLTTKGDLYGYGTAAARIPVGTDGQVLTADAASTPGVKWAAPGAATATTLTAFEFSSFAKAFSNVNFATFTAVNGAAFNGYRASDNAQNDEVVFLMPAALTAGTWTIALQYSTLATAGIYTISTSPDATTFTDVGTVDGYSASTVNFNRSEVTGITVAAGVKYVRLKMATKNASSSNYGARLCGISGVRTGA